MYHYLRVAGFHTDHQVMEVLAAGNAEKFHGTFHHTIMCIPVTAHNTVTERSMVRTDTDSSMMFFTDIDQGDEFFSNSVQFFLIVLIGIRKGFKFLFVYIVARIHTHFLDQLCGNFRSIRRVMYISNERYIIAPGFNTPANGSQVLRFLL
ncbi:hypothetical protein D3C86_1238240 [compost metagenome]